MLWILLEQALGEVVVTYLRPFGGQPPISSTSIDGFSVIFDFFADPFIDKQYFDPFS
jgi:hypothetical protein